MKTAIVFYIGNNPFEVLITNSALVQAAYDFIVTLYQTRKRDNGEPFLIHPISTVWILQNQFGHTLTDEDVIIALLHDALWVDYAQTKVALKNQFGESILDDVILLTKPHIIEDRAKQEEDERTQFFRLIESGRTDLLRIKYAERLHNMLELSKTNQTKQKRFLAITKNLYIDRFPQNAGLSDTIQNIFEEKYYEIVAQLNIQV